MALALHHLGVRTFALLVVTFLSILDHAELRAAEPRFRPALIGNGPKALINVIDTKRLIEKGQRDGLLMFKCYVDRFGKIGNYWIYTFT